MLGIMSKFMTKYTQAKNDSLNIILKFGDMRTPLFCYET